MAHEHERHLKVGDKIIITNCATDKHIGLTAAVAQIDVKCLGSRYLFAIRYRLDSGVESWCRAIPCTPLMQELL